MVYPSLVSLSNYSCPKVVRFGLGTTGAWAGQGPPLNIFRRSRRTFRIGTARAGGGSGIDGSRRDRRSAQQRRRGRGAHRRAGLPLPPASGRVPGARTHEGRGANTPCPTRQRKTTPHSSARARPPWCVCGAFPTASRNARDGRVGPARQMHEGRILLHSRNRISGYICDAGVAARRRVPAAVSGSTARDPCPLTQVVPVTDYPHVT